MSLVSRSPALAAALSLWDDPRLSISVTLRGLLLLREDVAGALLRFCLGAPSEVCAVGRIPVDGSVCVDELVLFGLDLSDFSL